MIIKTNSDELFTYRGDTSGLKAGPIDGVWLPENEEEIPGLFAQFSQSGRLLTIAGNGTGTTGGRVAPAGAVIGTDRLNKLGTIRVVSETEAEIECEAGVPLREVQIAARDAGWLYPPDPTEWNAFIGGTIATNASGARSFRYGATRNWIKAIRVVLADGFLLHIPRGKYMASGSEFDFSAGNRRFRFKAPTYEMPGIKHAAGFYSAPDMDLIDLFIGSEGTLGLITSATLRLIPHPEKQFSGILFFRTDADLMNFVSKTREISIANRNIPHQPSVSSLEYFDKESLNFLAAKYPQTPTNAAGAIYFEQDCTKTTEDDLLSFWFSVAEDCQAMTDQSWFAQTAHDDAFFKEYRHALPAQINEFLTRNQVKKISSDIAVPAASFAEMMHTYHHFLDGSPFRWVIFGHIGDCHLHMNILPHNAEEHAAGKQIYQEFITAAIALGGTISAEHGVGKLKVPYLEQMLGPDGIGQMATIKSYFDPDWRLGRGTLLAYHEPVR